MLELLLRLRTSSDNLCWNVDLLVIYAGIAVGGRKLTYAVI